MSNFTFFHNVFYTIYILKSFQSHISVVVCSFFELGAVFKNGVLGNGLTLSQTSPGFYMSAVQVFLKHCGKRRNCRKRAISPFPTVFSTCLKSCLPFSTKLFNKKLLSANTFNLDRSKICCLGKG